MSDIVERLRQAAKFGGHYTDAADEIARLRQALADAQGLLISYRKWASQSEDLAHDAELHFSAFRENSSVIAPGQPDD